MWADIFNDAVFTCNYNQSRSLPSFDRKHIHHLSTQQWTFVKQEKLRNLLQAWVGALRILREVDTDLHYLFKLIGGEFQHASEKSKKEKEPTSVYNYNRLCREVNKIYRRMKKKLWAENVFFFLIRTFPDLSALLGCVKRVLQPVAGFKRCHKFKLRRSW